MDPQPRLSDIQYIYHIIGLPLPELAHRLAIDPQQLTRTLSRQPMPPELTHPVYTAR